MYHNPADYLKKELSTALTRIAELEGEKEALTQELIKTRLGRKVAWDETDEAESQRDKAMALLRELEWHDQDDDGVDRWAKCPICMGTKEDGHYDDCQLLAILEEGGGE